MSAFVIAAERLTPAWAVATAVRTNEGFVVLVGFALFACMVLTVTYGFYLSARRRRALILRALSDNHLAARGRDDRASCCDFNIVPNSARKGDSDAPETTWLPSADGDATVRVDIFEDDHFAVDIEAWQLTWFFGGPVLGSISQLIHTVYVTCYVVEGFLVAREQLKFMFFAQIDFVRVLSTSIPSEEVALYVIVLLSVCVEYWMRPTTAGAAIADRRRQLIQHTIYGALIVSAFTGAVLLWFRDATGSPGTSTAVCPGPPSPPAAPSRIHWFFHTFLCVAYVFEKHATVNAGLRAAVGPPPRRMQSMASTHHQLGTAASFRNVIWEQAFSLIFLVLWCEGLVRGMAVIGGHTSYAEPWQSALWRAAVASEPQGLPGPSLAIVFTACGCALPFAWIVARRWKEMDVVVQRWCTLFGLWRPSVDAPRFQEGNHQAMVAHRTVMDTSRWLLPCAVFLWNPWQTSEWLLANVPWSRLCDASGLLFMLVLPSLTLWLSAAQMRRLRIPASVDTVWWPYTTVSSVAIATFGVVVCGVVLFGSTGDMTGIFFT